MPLGLGFLPALRFFILRYPKLQDMGRLPREFGEEVSELAELLLEEALSELRRLTRDDFMPGSQRKERNGANEEQRADVYSLSSALRPLKCRCKTSSSAL